MYGMINQAVEDLVRTVGGDGACERVRERAALEPGPFLAMESYPDEITYRLVEAASEVLSLPQSEILASFGEHWVLYTAQEGYGDLLAMGGATIREFLENLHELHAQVAMGFPNLRPPSFWTTEGTATTIRVHYESTRSGLAAMVVGLLQGLGKLYGAQLTVSHDRRVADGAEHDEFLVEYPPTP